MTPATKEADKHPVHCPRCDATVMAIERGRIWCPGDPQEDAYIFLQCPMCQGALVVIASCYDGPTEGDLIWDRGEKLWSSADATSGRSIPVGIAKDLHDAKKCLDANVYSASVVMCGRALEGIVQAKTNARNLAKGLANLRKMRIIDERLYDWSELLRKERNLGASPAPRRLQKKTLGTFTILPWPFATPSMS